MTDDYKWWLLLRLFVLCCIHNLLALMKVQVSSFEENFSWIICQPLFLNASQKNPENTTVEKYYSQLTVACQNKQHNKPRQHTQYEPFT